MAQPDPLTRLRQEVAEANQRLLDAVAALDNDQIQQHPGGTLPSIAFHLWHTARWADVDAHPGSPREQAWHARGFAERWRLEGIDASDQATGTGLSDEQAAALELPGRVELVAYARAAFDEFERWLGVPGSEGPRAEGALTHLTHVNRHLGMIEAIRGLLGLRGTATR